MPWLLRDCRLRHCLQRLEIANSADAAAQISFLGPIPFASRGDPLSSPIPARPPQLPPPPLLPSVWSEMSLDSLSPPSLPSTFLGSRRREGRSTSEIRKRAGALASFTRCGGGMQQCLSDMLPHVRTYNMHGKRRAHKKTAVVCSPHCPVSYRDTSTV